MTARESCPRRRVDGRRGGTDIRAGSDRCAPLVSSSFPLAGVATVGDDLDDDDGCKGIRSGGTGRCDDDAVGGVDAVVAIVELAIGACSRRRMMALPLAVATTDWTPPLDGPGGTDDASVGVTPTDAGVAACVVAAALGGVRTDAVADCGGESVESTVCFRSGTRRWSFRDGGSSGRGAFASGLSATMALLT